MQRIQNKQYDDEGKYVTQSDIWIRDKLGIGAIRIDHNGIHFGNIMICSGMHEKFQIEIGESK